MKKSSTAQPLAYNNVMKKIYTMGQSLNADPLTFKKAVLVCFYVMGIRFTADFFLSIFKLDIGIMPNITFLVVVLIIARKMGKDELRRVFAWRDVPLPVFAGIMVMFFGVDMIRSELSNLLQILLPVPNKFFNGWFYEPNNVFLAITSISLFPGFTEEILFRGVIARKFFRTYSPCKAVVLNAVLFGIMHINPWQMTNSFLGGIFYGWIYWRYRSIWLCMFMHAYNNVLAVFMSYPYIRIEDYTSYQLMWHHPAWFNILGLLLFGFGLLTVIVLHCKEKKLIPVTHKESLK